MPLGKTISLVSWLGQRGRAVVVAMAVVLTIAALAGHAHETVKRETIRRDTLRQQYRQAVAASVVRLLSDVETVAVLLSSVDESESGELLDRFLDRKRDDLAVVRYLEGRDPVSGKSRLLLWSGHSRDFNPAAVPGMDTALSGPRMHLLPFVRSGEGGGEDAGERGMVLVDPLAAGWRQQGDRARAVVALVDVSKLMADAFAGLPDLHDSVVMTVQGQEAGRWSYSNLNGQGLVPDHIDRVSGDAGAFELAFMAPSLTFAGALWSWSSLVILAVGATMASAVSWMAQRAAVVSVHETGTAIQVLSAPAPAELPTIELESSVSRDAALAQLRLVGALGRSLCHDLGQPFNVIRLAAEGILVRSRDGLPTLDRLERGLGSIVDQVCQAQQHLQELVGLCVRPETPASAISPVECVKVALSWLVERLKSEDIQLIWQPDMTTPWVLGHPERLERAVHNLLMNACDSISAAALSARSRPAGRVGTLRVRCHGGVGGNVVISIEDDGVGLPPSIQRLLNAPTQTEADRLKGIGLPMALGLVAEMGGHLEAPAVEMGARIDIYLPGVPALQLRRRRTDARRHLLVVDDEKEAVAEIVAYFEDAGWKVSSANGGNDAWDRFLIDHVDAVVTDLHMGNGDGIALISRVHEYAPELPILVVTTARDDEAQMAIRAGATMILTKPVSLTDISDELDGLL